MSQPKQLQKREEYEEPKSVIINSYIHRVDKIEDLIEQGRYADALHSMCTFANRLNVPQNETELIKAIQDLNRNDERPFMPASVAQGYWRMINKWLNENPFADITRAKPKSTDRPKLGNGEEQFK